MNTLRYLGKCLAWFLLSWSLLPLAACTSVNGQYGKPSGSFNPNATPDAVPKVEALNRYANPTSYKVGGRRYYVMRSAKGYDQTGYASWYGTKFHGQRTSSREPYDMYSMTAASPVLPIPSYVRVTNLQNGRSAVVKINDRGPFRSNRIIDLSYAAAAKLGYSNRGTALVRVTAVTSGIMAKSYAANTLPNQPSSFSQSRAAVNHTTVLAQNKSMYLQVGAYKDRQQALNVSKKIAALTRTEVAVKSGYSNHGRIYRLHIGPLADMGQSSEVSRLLQKNGYDKPLPVAG